MQSSKFMANPKNSYPVLPAPLTFPLKVIPDSFHSGVLVIILNQVLKNELEAGDLDFLQGRSVCIKLADADIACRLTLSANRLKTCSDKNNCDLSIQASIYDFLSIISRQEDADTLVFQRRLIMEGDTELGLSLKNYLDGMDIDDSRLLPFIETMARKTLPVYRRLFT